MRYVIKTADSAVWSSIHKWHQEGKLQIVEQGDPVEAMKRNVEAIRECMDTLRKTGVSPYVMKKYIIAETKISQRDVETVLEAQADFFLKLGVRR